MKVEGGNIDQAHHRGHAKKAVTEAAAMEEAVQLAMTLTDEEDTLLIVTSDHSHSLAINGYARRGISIFGKGERPGVVGLIPADGKHKKWKRKHSGILSLVRTFYPRGERKKLNKKNTLVLSLVS